MMFAAKNKNLNVSKDMERFAKPEDKRPDIVLGRTQPPKSTDIQ